ncbi:MAG: TIGR01620 family protein [Paracoccaceae bacterium]|nr:TIGR01620 family protein [Paracoccaceae bacterium]
MSKNNAPIIIDLDDDVPGPSPAEAAPVADPVQAPTGQAMQTVATLASRPRSPLLAWFWRLLLAVVLFFAGVALWDFVAGLVARNVVLGWIAVTLLALFAVTCLALILREAAALVRLRRMDRFQTRASAVRDGQDLSEAKAFASELNWFYRDRDDLSWGRARLTETMENCFDPETVLSAVEDQLLAPLDAAAVREVEAAARQVATVTALVPLALADVIAALTANLRMIRRIAEVYGGRAGTLGSWRLTRAVITHLVATGAVAVGDDLLGSIGGGTLLSKISRRFGEGLVNGALTARVGIAAMEVCRPVAFSKVHRPSVTGVIRRALTGLFDKEKT